MDQTGKTGGQEMSSHRVLSIENTVRTITSRNEGVCSKIDKIVGMPVSSIPLLFHKKK